MNYDELWWIMTMMSSDELWWILMNPWIMIIRYYQPPAGESLAASPKNSRRRREEMLKRAAAASCEAPNRAMKRWEATPSSHPFINGIFHEINHPLVPPWLWKLSFNYWLLIHAGWWWLEPWNFEWLSIYWEFHNPNWRTHIFQRDWNHQPVMVFSMK